MEINNLLLVGWDLFKTNAPEISTYVIGLAIYVIVIWHYYRLLAKRDFFSFEEKEEKRLTDKLHNFFGRIEFISKYIIFYPIISFIFFLIFTSLLFLFANNLPIMNILFISTVIISVARVTSYYSEELARDVAKLVPFSLLAVFVAQVNFSSVSLIFEKFLELQNFVPQILSFLIYFLALELVLRITYSTIIKLSKVSGLERRRAVHYRQKLLKNKANKLIEEKKREREIEREKRRIKNEITQNTHNEKYVDILEGLEK